MKMLEHLIELAVRLGWSAFRKSERAPRVPPTNPSRARAIQAAYRTWAIRRGLEADALGRTYRGRLSRYEVAVTPGIDGSTASSIEVATTIEHRQTTAILLKAASDGSTVLEVALSSLFAEVTFGHLLRSVAVTGEGVTIRFQAMSPPELVERCVLAAFDIVEHSRPQRECNPYR